MNRTSNISSRIKPHGAENVNTCKKQPILKGRALGVSSRSCGRPAHSYYKRGFKWERRRRDRRRPQSASYSAKRQYKWIAISAFEQSRELLVTVSVPSVKSVVKRGTTDFTDGTDTAEIKSARVSMVEMETYLAWRFAPSEAARLRSTAPTEY